MNSKRLLKLAAFLIALPRQKFQYNLVALEVAPENGGKPMLEALRAKKSKCGTVACAMGWTPAVFPRLMKWTEGEESNDGTGNLQLDVESCVTGRIRDGAMQELFGISEDQVSFLFYPESNGNRLGDNATAKQVGRNIVRFVKWNEKRLAKNAKNAKNEKLRESLKAQLDKVEFAIDGAQYEDDYPRRG